MAAQITHMLAGEEALKKALGEDLAGIPDEALARFRFGCQGPDIFYHNQKTRPSGLHYGSLAHRKNAGSLVAGAAAAVPEAERRPDSPLGAYILGLATHAAVDRATHPFIICFSGWADPADPSTLRRRGCHPFLERILDAALLESRLGLSPARYGISERMGTVAPGLRNDARVIDAALVAPWAAGLRAAYPRATEADSLLETRVANALADARGFYEVTDPSSPRASPDASGEVRITELPVEEARYILSLVYPLRIPSELDPMNEAKAEWPHPSGDGRSSRSSYLDLVDEGIDGAAKALGLVLAFWRGEIAGTTLAEELGEGSLALCDADGKAAMPRICRPLPLPEAMDAEYGARMRSAR
jgi:hypothetical protein